MTKINQNIIDYGSSVRQVFTLTFSSILIAFG